MRLRGQHGADRNAAIRLGHGGFPLVYGCPRLAGDDATRGYEMTEDFAHDWHDVFGVTPPLGYLLRQDFAADWLRFHALPDAQRYGVTQDDAATILQRANALADACFGAANDLWITSGATSLADLGLDLPPALQATVPDDAAPMAFHAARIVWSPQSLDGLFAAIADDACRAVLFSPPNLIALAPYDGGFDVICRDPTRRDELRARFQDWMSDRADGL